ncbi:MAG: L,D-transpeptidase [Parachlamydiaceae bacterium]
MSFPKVLLILAATLFGLIAVAAGIKHSKNSSVSEVESSSDVEGDIAMDLPEEEYAPQEIEEELPVLTPVPAPPRPDSPLPEADRIQEFFNKTGPKFPIVLTVTYKSRVPWQKGRPAWLSDYASHYATSRHFIARSLNGKADYFKQDVSEGDRFNVLNPDKKIQFLLLIDTSRCKMWFYYIDLDTNERVLVKSYNVGLGRIDSTKSSGMLTPLGKYTLGSKIAIYKPKLTGFHNGQKVELIRVFGTRWIPFDKEMGDCSAAAEGFGIHGLPWQPNDKGELVERKESLGKYESDGCIRLATPDIEELFAIIITRPTTIELVKDFYEAKLPGIER